MTIWQPNLEALTGPRYKAIADALASDIASGSIEPGSKLPTHRDLAYHLGVTVGTVSRGYAEAERRGLTSGEVGRGTFVRERGSGRKGTVPIDSLKPADAIAHAPADGTIDLVPAFLAPAPRTEAFSAALHDIADRPDIATLLDYETQGGFSRHRTILAEWASQEAGAPLSADHLSITNGSQHGILTSLLAITTPGDIVATETFCYPPVKAITEMLGRKLIGVASDDEGMIPDALDALCRRTPPRALYITPTMQNPTTSTMSDPRRAAILDIAARYGITVICDDIYGYLSDIDVTSMVAMAPDHVIHISGLSKSAAPGLRVGMVSTPPGLTDSVRAAIRATTWSAAPLSVEVGCRWVEDGTLATLKAWHRNEARRRQKIAREIFGLPDKGDSINSYFMWLTPTDTCSGTQHWRSSDLVARLAEQNVRVVGEDVFFVPGLDGNNIPPTAAIRIGIGTPETDAMLRRGLEAIQATIDNPAICQVTVV